MKHSKSFSQNFSSRLRLRLSVGLLSGCLWCVASVKADVTNSKPAPPPPPAPTARPVARLIASIKLTKSDVVPNESHAHAATAAITPARVAAGATSVMASSAMGSIERRAFDLINAERTAAGEAPFIWDEELNRMARLHSENMARLDFFAHTGPDGLDTVERARACAIKNWSALGENIAYNQGFDDPAAFAVERWMHSTKHRTNILNQLFSRSGLGVARAADGRIFFTQVFAAR